MEQDILGKEYNKSNSRLNKSNDMFNQLLNNYNELVSYPNQSSDLMQANGAAHSLPSKNLINNQQTQIL